ncbi:RICIN domain-containing protein [Glycomyces sp. TRM65418]|uniref:RICIN domain-containing protein n=1 Tax=Glycomyces sp. TRM65418 TaxID=2867006 RepID=UPI001D160AA6|nr:RICIN domain-containing protein [Glycomyces sp. TRM65418]MCC3765852.1 RICIN domain-containing protein [Glycomyces sp. TRM65418]
MSQVLKRRLALLLATLAAAVTGIAIAFVAIPQAGAVETGVWYKIVSRHSGLTLDVLDRSTAPGAELIQWNDTGATNQQFRFVDAGGGYYRIQARHSNLVLETYEWSTANGATIAQWTDLNGTNQQWQVQESGGYATFVNRHSGKALDVWEKSTTAGGRISQYTPNGGVNQQFQLVEVDGDGGGGDPGTGECGSGTPNATVTGSSGNYTARNGSSTLYTGSDYRNAIQTAVDSIGSGQRVAVMASGSIGASTISISSGKTFEGCGTINAANRGGRGAIESLGTSNVSIPYLNVTGSPYFATRFYGNSNLHLGQVNLNLSGGAGIRFERDFAASSDVTIDYVYVAGTSGHGVETWNIDGLTIGTVVARNTGYAGLLLNNTRNADIGLVDGDNVATGTGYATFRTANTAGRLANGSYATNIYVDKVVSRGGGRGIFCVSQSGGVNIRNVDLANNGNNAILIENCYGYTIQSGTVNGGGEVRIAARSEFPNTRDTNITLTVNNTSVRESPCADNSTWNLSGNGSRNIC